MSAATNRTERLATALKDARPDFTLRNARVFSRAVIDAPDGVFGEKPLTFLPDASPVASKDVTTLAETAAPAVGDAARTPAEVTWRGNASLRKLAEDADARLTQAEVNLTAAREEHERHINPPHDGPTPDCADHAMIIGLGNLARAAEAAVQSAKACLDDIAAHHGGPVPGYLVLNRTGRWLGLVVSGGQVVRWSAPTRAHF